MRGPSLNIYSLRTFFQAQQNRLCNPTHIDVFTTSLKPLLQCVCLFGHPAVLHRVLKWFGVEQNKITWLWMRGPGNYVSPYPETTLTICLNYIYRFSSNVTKGIVRVHFCLFYESYQTHISHERSSFLMSQQAVHITATMFQRGKESCIEILLLTFNLKNLFAKQYLLRVQTLFMN
jgi:hypothetical protein